MSQRTLILVGGPDSGKTNYIARLWESIRSKTGALIAPHPPQNVEFVEKALEFLLKGEFAPRSNRDVAESTHSFEVSVRKACDANGPLSDILVPDVTGELWKKTLGRRRSRPTKYPKTGCKAWEVHLGPCSSFEKVRRRTRWLSTG